MQQPDRKRQRIVTTPIPEITYLYTFGKSRLNSPRDIAISENRILYVADTDNHRIQCFTLRGEFVCAFGEFGSENGKYNEPQGLSLENLSQSILHMMQQLEVLCGFPPGVLPIVSSYVGDDHIYVADTLNHRIQVVNSGGLFVRKWRHPNYNDDWYPQSCKMGKERRVYVCSNRIHRHPDVFDANGNVMGSLHTRGFVQFPRTIVPSLNGEQLYIIDNAELFNFYVDGPIWWCRRDFKYTACIGDAEGRVYATDTETLHVLDAEGKYLCHFTPTASKCKAFRRPQALAIGPNCCLYILDSFNNRIVVLSI